MSLEKEKTRIEIPVRNWHKSLAEAIREGDEDTIIVVNSEAQLELGSRAAERMESPVQFELKGSSEGDAHSLFSNLEIENIGRSRRDKFGGTAELGGGNMNISPRHNFEPIIGDIDPETLREHWEKMKKIREKFGLGLDVPEIPSCIDLFEFQQFVNGPLEVARVIPGEPIQGIYVNRGGIRYTWSFFSGVQFQVGYSGNRRSGEIFRTMNQSQFETFKAIIEAELGKDDRAEIQVHLDRIDADYAAYVAEHPVLEEAEDPCPQFHESVWSRMEHVLEKK